MKYSFKSILLVLIMVLAAAGISCSQNGNGSGVSGGNIKAGSSSDPFRNSSWSMSEGNSAGKIIAFSNGNNVVYGGASGYNMKGTYTVNKSNSSYTATCKFVVDGSTVYIKMEVASFAAKVGEMSMESLVYTLYRL